VGAAIDSQIIANVVFGEDVSLDEEHRNAGGAPVEDESPIGQDVGWWTAVFLSMSTSIG
jgi:UDP-3-O-[3-hydroxymyristoyl] glucosamine N-acyltransferase